MRAHYLQHVPFEGLGTIQPWLELHRAEITVTRLFEEGARLPDPRDIDLLIVMGGPMSVNDEALHPWLVDEKRFIAATITEGNPVLGICLGAQLIASGLGAKVFGNPEREIGWFPIEPTSEASSSPFAEIFASPMEVFHWHGETFELPPGATHLAHSAACINQAFAIGERVLALQFHLETTSASARALVENCPGDLASARWVQSAQEILGNEERFQRINPVINAVLDRLF